jgi:hypothetical protein
LAFVQYVQDNDEAFPMGNPNGCTTAPGPKQMGVSCYGNDNGWAGEIYLYLKSNGVFDCPDDPTVSAGSTYIPSSPTYVQTDDITPCGTAAMTDGIGDKFTLTFSPI